MSRNIALVYIRRSFIRKGQEATSPAKQEANCRRICKESTWVAEVYRDAAEGKHFSAMSETGRPAWLKLKRQLGRPNVVAVVVDSLDRAYRSLRDFLNFLALLDKYNVRFISRREAIDTESVMGRAFLKMAMIFFELEAEMARQRVLDIIQYRKGTGLHWGNNPFGLDRDEKGVLIANEDLPTAILILELYAAGFDGCATVARELNARGKRYRDRYDKTKPFTRDSVRAVVGNILIYAGYVPQGRGKDHQHILLDPDHDLVDQLLLQTDAIRGQHDPFIRRELANRVLIAKRSRIKPRHAARVYLLSGILHCAHCGGPMRGQRARWEPVRFWYRHHGKVCTPYKMVLDAGILESQVIDLLQSLKLPPQLQDTIRARAREQGAFLPEDDETKRAIAHLQSKMRRLREMRLEGEYTRDEYLQQKRLLVEELGHWEQQTGVAINEINQSLLDLGNLAEVIRRGPPAAQKKAIQALFQRLEVNSEGKIVKAVPHEWCRPLFATLYTLLSTCDIVGPQGDLTPHYVANLQAMLNLVDFANLSDSINPRSSARSSG